MNIEQIEKLVKEHKEENKYSYYDESIDSSRSSKQDDRLFPLGCSIDKEVLIRMKSHQI